MVGRIWFVPVFLVLAAELVLPQSQAPPPNERVVKCSEQKDATRARKLALKQLENGKLDKAEGCARAVLRIRGETASAADWENLGIILNRRGKMQGAVNALRNAVARDDHVRPPAEVRVERRLELANALLGLALPDDAMEQYRECASIAPNMPGPYINGGNVHLHRGNFKAAEHFYRTALQLDPSNFDAIVNLGALMAATARGELAVKEYRRALALAPDNVDALLGMGSLQMDMGDVKSGLVTFKEASKLNQEHAPLCHNLANAYLANGEVQEAMDMYQRAIGLSPTLLSAKCSLASILAMHGRYDEAKTLLQQPPTSTAAAVRGSGKGGSRHAGLGDALHDASAEPVTASGDATSDGMWRLTANCLLLALQVEASEWDVDTEEHLQHFVRAFIADILASSRAAKERGGETSEERGGDSSEHRQMRLRAMSLCLHPSRSLYVHGMNHHQELIAAIYFWKQALERARALPRLLPTPTPLFWKAHNSMTLGYLFVAQDSNVESVMDMLFLARHSTAHDGRRISYCYSLQTHTHTAWYLEIKVLCGKRFHDLSALSHSQAAKQINSHGIHMLIDTVGHGYGKRSEVLAMEPSALQVEVRALRTSGAARVLLSDTIVTPPEYLPPRPSAPLQVLNAAALGGLDDAVSLCETVVMLPKPLSSSFSARHQHSNLHEVPSRSDADHRRRALQHNLALPTHTPSVLYGYAGRLHAVTDLSLSAWIGILNASSHALLVLPDHPPGAKERVWRRAGALGLVSPQSRLIFIPDVALNHTARCHLVAALDVLLDTAGRSVGAAAAEALLVSAPLITVPGRALDSRTAASQILGAYPQTGGPPLLEHHPPHLVARNVEDFIQLAIRAGAIKTAAQKKEKTEGGDEWLPFVPYLDMREHLLVHDGAWWVKYNTGMRMLWESHLVLYHAKDADDAHAPPNEHDEYSELPFPSSARHPHIIVA